jgi:hypothetical protein
MADPQSRYPAHEHDDHAAPERTTPQGTQEYGVEHGHEEHDVHFRPLVGWIVGLWVTVFLVFVLMQGMFHYLVADQGSRYPLASPLLGKTQVPGQPRIWPNPADRPAEPYEEPPGPQAMYRMERAREGEALQKLGLEDPGTRAAALPPRAVDSVLADQGGGMIGTNPDGQVRQPMPSGPSGGTMLEDRLR